MHCLRFISLAFCVVLGCCSPAGKQAADSESVEGARIAWDYSSETKISDRGAYARVKKLLDGSYIAAFEDRRGSVCISRSDDLVNWSEPEKVISGFSTKISGTNVRVNVANAEIIQLADGTLLCGGNYRPATEGVYPYSIVVARSEDSGATWSAPNILYKAGNVFGDGCWEPSFLQLPDGTVHIYFANESPYRHSDEQEISLLVSTDSGRSWSSDARTVSFRKNRRDGMPVAALFDDEIVVVIEDNKQGQFKPYTVRTSLDSLWCTPVFATSGMRDYALSEVIPDSVYMGAPYIQRLSGGEAVISYQTTSGRTSEWELSCMEVAIGDNNARSFGKRTRPFDVPLDKEGKWNSLSVIDSTTILAVSSSNKDGGEIAPWIKKGYIIKEDIIGKGTENKRQFFIGERSCSNMSAGVGLDGNTLIVNIDVNDTTISPKDAVTFLMDVSPEDSFVPSESSLMLYMNRDGKTKVVSKGADGVWKQRNRKETGWMATATAVFKKDSGYKLEFKLQGKLIEDLQKAGSGRISFVFDDAGASGETDVQPLVHSHPDIPATWLRMHIEKK